MKKIYINETTAFIFLLVIGIFFRFLQFGNYPAGFHGDEASIGYEAYSLLETGKDRWGFKLPAYFLSWGSGQNTLYGYLSIPFIYVFGLNETSVRLLSGVLGILCIPMVYYLIITLFNNKTLARLVAIIYLFDPFLFMTSRWGDEFNLVPFFVILTLLIHAKSITLIASQATHTIIQKLIILAIFPSLVLLFYAYAPSLFIVPLFVIFSTIFYWNIWQKQWKLIGFSMLLGFLIILPFALFILKNNILKHSIPFESNLPFSLPIMLSARERVFIGLAENFAIIKQNMMFVFSGFVDYYVWIYNSTNFRNPHFLLFFMVPGLLLLVLTLKANKSDPKNILLFWFFSSFSIFFLYHVNCNRSLHFQSIVPIFTGIGIFTVYEKLTALPIKKIFVGVILSIFLFQSLSFFGEYFFKYPTYSVFPKDVEWAVKLAQKNKKQNEKIAFSKQLVFNYLYAAFHLKYPPAQFQQQVKTDKTTGNVIVKSFGDYFMLGDVANVGIEDNIDVIDSLKKEKSFIAMLRTDEQPKYFQGFDIQVISHTLAHDWKVIRYIKR
jgi:4-amino-4-deoxy-L-arabinose transferase-like glycosyltransferase